MRKTWLCVSQIIYLGGVRVQTLWKQAKLPRMVAGDYNLPYGLAALMGVCGLLQELGLSNPALH